MINTTQMVAISNKAVDVIVWVALWFTLGVVAGSCAHSRTPYTEETSTGAWIGDISGDQDMSVLRVINPLGSSVRVTVGCVTDAGRVDLWNVDVAPQGSTSVLFQKLAKNWGVNVCSVESWVRR